MKAFNLESYLSNGVEVIIKGILKAAAKNPRTALFMMQYAKTSGRARKLRIDAEGKGEHIPPFLIASITNQCNLHCKGCYARANHSCVDGAAPDGMLTADEWKKIFEQAAELGCGFILLAGGEPLVRQDVLEAAATQKELLFPVFTNGTMLNDKYLKLFSDNPNLIPILSIEGNEAVTDERRGQGIYHQLQQVMTELKKRGILFGASVTVHKNNMAEVLSDEFRGNLSEHSCKAVIYVEYVPISKETEELAMDDEARDWMGEELNRLRMKTDEMIYISFPGDEKTSGGCLAAGRGFFHINVYGGAEPCPFSPYSDTSLKDVSLKEALNSPLFLKLRTSGTLMQEHKGGCVLFEQEKQVKEMAGEA